MSNSLIHLVNRIFVVFTLSGGALFLVGCSNRKEVQKEVAIPKRDAVSVDEAALPESELTAPPEVASEKIRHLMENTLLFTSGTENTHTFRIPALITAPNGDLIAGCDARRKSKADLRDSYDTDIVIKRSSDNGESWSELEAICDFGEGRPASDPSFILDKTTGKIFCFYNYMDHYNAPDKYHLYVQHSSDSGKHWGVARDITKEISKPEWERNFKFISSGRGIQLQSGELLHNLVHLRNRGLYLFGSKDHGASWYLNDVLVTPANESKLVELADGSWMINSRVDRAEDSRWVHVSKDLGQTWSSFPDRNLIDPGCNASIIRYTSKKEGYSKDRLLFCNPSSPDRRRNLAVRISYDEGKTWSKGKVIDPGFVAYSSLSICADGSIAVLYEANKDIRFARFTLEDLTDGKDHLSPKVWK